MASGDLLDRAHGWVRERTGSPHLEHLERTLAYAMELDPGASEALRLAALTHDIERSYPEGRLPYDSAFSWDDPTYNRLHQDRSADIVAGWLRDQGAAEPLVAHVEALVRVHENGGSPEADVLQAADSLSFLETMTGLVLGWLDRVPRERAQGKLQHSYDRIRVERARALAGPLLERALHDLQKVPARA